MRLGNSSLHSGQRMNQLLKLYILIHSVLSDIFKCTKLVYTQNLFIFVCNLLYTRELENSLTNECTKYEPIEYVFF